MVLWLQAIILSFLFLALRFISISCIRYDKQPYPEHGSQMCPMFEKSASKTAIKIHRKFLVYSVFLRNRFWIHSCSNSGRLRHLSRLRKKDPDSRAQELSTEPKKSGCYSWKKRRKDQFNCKNSYTHEYLIY